MTFRHGQDPLLHCGALLIGAVMVIGWTIVATLAKSASSRADHDPKASDLHGSNANFGNNLRGDNSNFGRGLYDE